MAYPAFHFDRRFLSGFEYAVCPFAPLVVCGVVNSFTNFGNPSNKFNMGHTVYIRYQEYDIVRMLVEIYRPIRWMH